MNLGRVVQVYKSLTTVAYAAGVHQQSWSPFPGRLWQRNYWDHVIRNESDLLRIRDYIRNNPCQWEPDALFMPESETAGATRVQRTPT